MHAGESVPYHRHMPLIIAYADDSEKWKLPVLVKLAAQYLCTDGLSFFR